jgi:hypothetical protein
VHHEFEMRHKSIAAYLRVSQHDGLWESIRMMMLKVLRECCAAHALKRYRLIAD